MNEAKAFEIIGRLYVELLALNEQLQVAKGAAVAAAFASAQNPPAEAQ